MPRAVLGSGGADFVLVAEAIGAALETLVCSTGLASAAFALPRISRSVLERAG